MEKHISTGMLRCNVNERKLPTDVSTGAKRVIQQIDRSRCPICNTLVARASITLRIFRTQTRSRRFSGRRARKPARQTSAAHRATTAWPRGDRSPGSQANPNRCPGGRYPSRSRARFGTPAIKASRGAGGAHRSSVAFAATIGELKASNQSSCAWRTPHCSREIDSTGLNSTRPDRIQVACIHGSRSMSPPTRSTR